MFVSWTLCDVLRYSDLVNILRTLRRLPIGPKLVLFQGIESHSIRLKQVRFKSLLTLKLDPLLELDR